MEVFEILSKSEEDVSRGRVAPIQDTFDDLRKLLTKETEQHLKPSENT